MSRDGDGKHDTSLPPERPRFTDEMPPMMPNCELKPEPSPEGVARVRREEHTRGIGTDGRRDGRGHSR